MSQTVTALDGSVCSIVSSRPSSTLAPLGLAGPRGCDRARRRPPPARRTAGAAAVLVRELGDEGQQRQLGVTDERQGAVVDADALGSGVEVDDLAAEAQAVLGGRLGAQFGADAQHHVGGGQQLLQGGLVAARAGGERVIGGDRALAHVGRGHRGLEELGELAQLAAGAGAQDAAAGPDDRALGVGQAGRGGQDLLQRRALALHHRLERRHRSTRGGRAQHVDRDLEVDGTARRGERDAPRLRQQSRGSTRCCGRGPRP